MSKIIRPDFADPCRNCGQVDRLIFHAETFEWECRDCGRRWRADPHDPRLPRNGEPR